VAELVDALASGASGLTAVKVRVLSWAPSIPAARFRRRFEQARVQSAAAAVSQKSRP
jgi:hypothetical protein